MGKIMSGCTMGSFRRDIHGGNGQTDGATGRIAQDDFGRIDNQTHQEAG